MAMLDSIVPYITACGGGDEWTEFNWSKDTVEKNVAAPAPREQLQVLKYTFPDDTPLFEGHRQLAVFGIDANLNLDEEAVIPTLVQVPENLEELLLGKDLKEGHEKNELITDYMGYRSRKWQYFLDTIKSKSLLNGKPDFVCFAGVLTTLMNTPYNYENWNITAQKVKGVIFLKKVRNEEMPYEPRPPRTPREPRTPRDGEEDKPRVPAMHFLLKFVQLATSTDTDKPVVESEKAFEVFEVKYGKRKLMLMDEADAEIDGSKVKLVAYRTPNHEKAVQRFKAKKVLNAWSQASVCGIKSVTFCEYDNDEIVKSVTSRSPSELVEFGDGNFLPIQCRDFLNRFFAFVVRVFSKTDRDDAMYRFWFANKQFRGVPDLNHQTVSYRELNEEEYKSPLVDVTLFD